MKANSLCELTVIQRKMQELYKTTREQMTSHDGHMMVPIYETGSVQPDTQESGNRNTPFLVWSQLKALSIFKGFFVLMGIIVAHSVLTLHHR